MKKQIILTFLLGIILSASICYSQGIYNNGAKIVVSSGTYLMISGGIRNESSGSDHGAMDIDGIVSLTGNYVNNATSGNGLSNAGTNGETIFAGSGAQTISGTADGTDFEKLTVNSGVVLNPSNQAVTVHGTTTLSGTGYVVTVGTQKFELLGPLSGSGRFNVTDGGSLYLTPVHNVALTFPIGDGTNNENVTVTCLNAPSQHIGVKINNNQSITGTVASPLDLWSITGESNLNATMVFRIDKAAISPTALSAESFIMRYYNGSRYVPIAQSRVSVADQGTYYEITVTGVNNF